MFYQLSLLCLLTVSSALGQSDNSTTFPYALGAIIPKFRSLDYPAYGDEYLKYVDIPIEFDARKQWPKCSSLREIRDQAGCGSCVMFATAAAMTDRYCIHSNGQQNFRFSSEHLLSCAASRNICSQGSLVDSAWKYYQQRGVVSGGPYRSGQGCQPLTTVNNIIVTCYSQCTNGNYQIPFNNDLHFGNQLRSFATVAAAQREILTNGPVTAAFTVYSDFQTFDFSNGRIYERKSGSIIGGHQVKIIGWGETNGKKYWLIANSWGLSFGDGGYFRIARGQNECGIEANILSGLPLYK